MTPLGNILRRQIAMTGPITLSEYMTLCLLHPEHGYYTTRDPLGAEGDFTTAPEISQMFGELTGLALAQTWLDQGAPTPFALVELGPGRGTLMRDILRATRAVPGFCDHAQLHMVEASPTLRAAQRALVPDIHHHDGVETLPELPTYLIANEFFDALPIRQFLRDGDQWRERLIGIEGDALAFGLSAPMSVAGLEHRLGDTTDGDIATLCPGADGIAAQIGARIARHGGAALIIDYGDLMPTGDTFQAVSQHAKVAPLANPGAADLTAHVDFAAIARAAPCAHSDVIAQGLFLERLGITARAQALARALADEALENHIAAHRRLTHGCEMGTLFKVMALYPDGAAPPPGLTA